MKKTLVLTVDARNPDTKKIRWAASFIKKGGLVAFPTETVYGLGADALNAKAVSGLFKAKRRPLDNPPIVHVCDRKDVYRLAKTVPAKAEMLMRGFWPGPLTLILKRSSIVPSVTVADLDTIAVRIPESKIALALIKESDCPIAAPSANLAGRPSPTLAKHVLQDLNGHIDAILDAGPTRIGVESTVLDFTIDPPQVLRPGGTSFETLLKALGQVELNPAVTADKDLSLEKARSPGMKHKHYAPKAKVILVEGDLEAVVNKVNKLVQRYKAKGKRVGVLATDRTIGEYKAADTVKSLGNRYVLADVARNLFRLLRELDDEGVDLIVAESLPTEGLGLAIINRLRKAAGYNIVKA